MYSTRMGRRLAAIGLLLAAAWLLNGAAGAADTSKENDKALRQKALALNEITGEAPLRGQLKALHDDPAGSKKLLAVAAKMVKEKPQPFNYNAALLLSKVALKQKDHAAAADFLKVCVAEANTLKSGTKLGQAYGDLIAVYYDSGKYDEAVKVCQELLEMPADENTRNLIFFAWETMIQALARAGKTDIANKELDSKMEKQPDNWLLLELRGFVQRESGKLDDAAASYEKALANILKDKELEDEEKKTLSARVRYILSGVYTDANKIDKATDQLKKLLEQDPDSPSYNNDLGYIWADHDQNLDEAEKLIRKAIELDRKQRKAAGTEASDKDNAAYLDSLGWVLFKKKQYKEALAPLQQAVKDPEDGQHVEIYDHLAEVQMALGDKAAAIATWKKAMELPTRGKREEQRKAEIEKKLKMHQ